MTTLVRTPSDYALFTPEKAPSPRLQQSAPFVIFAVLLPAISLVTEWTTSLCAQTLFDPLPTLLHKAAVTAVPVLAAWMSWGKHQAFNALWLGIIASISAIYAIAFAPVTPVAVLLTLMGFGLLALSPLLCLAVTLRALWRYSRKDGLDLRLLSVGLSLGLALMVAAESPVFSSRLERACLGLKQTPMTWLTNFLATHYDTGACEEVYRQSGKVLQPNNGVDLSLKDSKLTTRMDSATGTAYTEWTMEFANASIRDGEARGVVQMPSGGVVSRATLWINGEEREAAFGASTQVRQAYESVTRINRDPLLVLWKGPDTVQFRCAPVPPHGRMRIKLGVTAPIIPVGRDRGRVAMPWLTESNFDGKGTGPSSKETTLAGVDQVMEKSTPWKDVTLVVDGSKWMRAHREAIAEFATRGEYRVLLATNDGDGFVWQTGDTLRQADFHGGVDNVPAIREALHHAAKGGTVVWIHGPQPFFRAGGIGSLRGAKPMTYRVEAGQNFVLDSIGDQANPIANTGNVTADLEQALAPVQRRIVYQQTAGITSTSRLWAASRVLELLEEGNREEAVELGIRYKLVTPVTGAVVLETAKQYVDNGLTPPEQGMVNTPEPSTLILTGSAFVLLFLMRRFISKGGRHPTRCPEARC